jgi:hypothetical protein
MDTNRGCLRRLIGIAPACTRRNDDSYELRYSALPGEVNQVDLDLGAGAVTVRDTGAPLLAGAFCTGDGDAVVCGAPTKPGRYAATSSASVDLGDGGGGDDDDGATVAGNVTHRDQGRQEHQTWALVSAAAASASVLVAIAAVIVAATH